MNLFNHSDTHRKARQATSGRSSVWTLRSAVSGFGASAVAAGGRGSMILSGGLVIGSYRQPCRATVVGNSTLRSVLIPGFGKNPQEDC